MVLNLYFFGGCGSVMLLGGWGPLGNWLFLRIFVTDPKLTWEKTVDLGGWGRQYCTG